MPQTREKLFRTENPKRQNIAKLQSGLRGAINKLVLSDEDFYDKLYALEATQRGDFKEFRTNPVVEKLDRARNGLAMITISRSLVVGHLAPESPWTFLDVSEGDEARIDLGVRLSEAYSIGDTNYWEHSSYGQCSTRSDTAPSVTQISDEQLAVGLPVYPVGSENLYGKVEAYADTVYSGEYAIHQRVATIQREKSDAAQAALHSAVSIAVSKMS